MSISERKYLRRESKVRRTERIAKFIWAIPEEGSAFRSSRSSRSLARSRANGMFLHAPTLAFSACNALSFVLIGLCRWGKSTYIKSSKKGRFCADSPPTVPFTGGGRGLIRPPAPVSEFLCTDTPVPAREYWSTRAQILEYSRASTAGTMCRTCFRDASGKFSRRVVKGFPTCEESFPGTERNLRKNVMDNDGGFSSRPFTLRGSFLEPPIDRIHSGYSEGRLAG